MELMEIMESYKTTMIDAPLSKGLMCSSVEGDENCADCNCLLNDGLI